MILRVYWTLKGERVHLRVMVGGYDVQNHGQLTHVGKQAGFENVVVMAPSFLSAAKPLRAASGQIALGFWKNHQWGG